MPRCVAAPDKLRGTATAREAAAAIAAGARAAGWQAARCPMSDGGEGLLEVLGGTRAVASVDGPLGAPVRAEWSLLDDGTAVIESAQAIGRARLAAPGGDDPLRASTSGVGQLLAAALAAGATSLLVGCGGSSTTDGGLGCVRALEAAGVRVAVPLVVACDVDVPFLEAAARFGPQKGATPAQVATLRARLVEVAARYERDRGLDVTTLRFAGAAGGLAGGLAALGGRLVAGAALVAGAVGLDARLAAADLVVTGEGHLDDQTLAGKVVAEVLRRARGVPALVVVGSADPPAARALAAAHDAEVQVVELDDALQRRLGTAGAIEHVVTARLADAAAQGTVERQAR